MPLLNQILNNNPLTSAFWAWFLAQAFKFATHYRVAGKIDIRQWVSSGGMPSSHSSSVCALTTSIGIQNGFDSSLFALSALFSIIVMYDATGVRRAASLQARALNQIIAELFEGHPISQSKLKELIGHTPIQVIVGAFFGVIIALLQAWAEGA